MRSLSNVIGRFCHGSLLSRVFEVRSQEVYHHIEERFQVILSPNLISQMSSNRGIPSGSNEGLFLSEGSVYLFIWLHVLTFQGHIYFGDSVVHEIYF